MKSIKSTVLSAVVAAAALAATLGTAQAQNPNYAPGDLVLFFQNPGGSTGSTQQLFASLGNTATVFRQAYVDQANLYDIVNIGSQLSSTFGSNWATATTLFESKSALANFKATQTDKTQSASVGSLEQQASVSNSLEQAGAFIGAIARAAAKP
jgi:hypothetical protein